jgi:hypothetical protein
MRCRTVIWLIPLWLGASALWAQDKGKDDKSTPDAQYKAIMEEYKTAQRELASAYRAAKTDADRKKIEDKLRKQPEEYAVRLLALAQKHPKTDAAFNALVFIVANTEGGATADKATDQLLQDHRNKLGDVFEELATTESPAAEKLLRTAMTKGTEKRVKGQATLALGQFLKNKADSAPKGDAKLAKEAEDLFDQVVAKYADQKDLVESAKDELFVIRNLAIGKVAPDIAGEDADGKKFKLSDYRGKVVVLDFWAGW